MIRLPARPLATVSTAVGVVAQIALIGWWAVTGATVVYVLLQLGLLAVAGFGLLAAGYRRSRREYEQEIARNAVLVDRNRLADELHDALGHELSVIALKAGSLQVRTAGKVQEQAADIRLDIEKTVERLHRALEGVRGPDATEPVGAMIDRLIESGVSITQVGRPPVRLSGTAESMLGQVLREALTNALKHAPGEPVAVVHRHTPGTVAVDIRNPAPATGKAQSAPRAAGTGIDALRRRIAPMGARISTREDHGVFVMTAEIPRYSRPPAAAAPDRPLHSPLGETVRSALVPAVVGALILLGFYAWSVRGAVIEEQAFARLHAGMPAVDATEVLPAREAPVRLVPTAEHAPDWSCAYYTDGNFPLGLAVFEVCANDGSLVRVTDLRRHPWL